MLEFIKHDFWHAAPVLFVAVFAIAITFERSFALFIIYPFKKEKAFFNNIRDLVLNQRLKDAIALCDKFRRKPMAGIVKEALLRSHQPLTSIEDGLEVAVIEATEALQKRTSFLSSIANVSTLMGLFGTIAGLIQSFASLGNYSAQEKAAMLASGISTALNATMLGIGVAIPCMIGYAVLVNQTNQITASIEKAAFKTLDILKQRYYQNSNQSNGQSGGSSHRAA